MTTRISDVVVPQQFAPYTQQLTKENSRIIQSGAMVDDAMLNSVLTGGGLTFTEPSFRDLASTAANVSSDDPSSLATPEKITASSEVQIRISRNQHWSSMDMAAALAGTDPADAIARLVAGYWTRQHQAAFVAAMRGVLLHNATVPGGSDTHTQNDMIYNVAGSGFVDGVTNFSSEAFLDAAVTMGDAMEDLTMVMMHSVVYNRALKNNLIDFVSDSANPLATRIATFLGREVVVSDALPSSSGVFDTWLFARGAFRSGMGFPKVPVATDRNELAGNGSGMETLTNRVEWIIHPRGYAFIGAPGNGGPSNGTGSNQLQNAGSWRRVFLERKQIGMACLKTREY